ncbi:MAG: hypothetical protein F4W95_07305 [Chloroflexi bacterium]|nr:hypothetical protein [Chloroflexota bacterium]MYD48278.1 hypothetical protein [Chloroflexota bacterium]
MSRYRWTGRIAFAGVAALALIIVFVTTVRFLDVAVAGVQPEAFVLTAMMTAPFTVGAVIVSTMAAALVETLR